MLNCAVELIAVELRMVERIVGFEAQHNFQAVLLERNTRYSERSQLLVPGPVMVFLPRLPNCGAVLVDNHGPALATVAWPAGSGGGPKRDASGAVGLMTSILAESEGVPVGELMPVIRLYPGVIGAPVSIRVTPESSQLSATQPKGRNPVIFPGLGRL